jgi:glycosyl transferase family 61
MSIGLMPRTRRHFSFPTEVVRPWDCDAEQICSETTVDAFPSLNPEQDRILTEAIQNDTGDMSCNRDKVVRVDTKIYAVHNCSFAGNSGAVLRDSDTRLVHPYRPAPTYTEARARRLKVRQAGPGRHIMLPYTVSHYHFLADGIVPLISFIEHFHRDRSPLAVVMRPPANGAQAEMLAALQLEYPFLRTVLVERDERLSGASLIYNFRIAGNSEWMPIEPAIVRRLSAILANYFGCSDRPASDRHTWFSRGHTNIRSIRNAAEIDALCTQLGLSKFVADPSDLRTQFETFRNSNVIVGVHGAGLANILFCHPGTTIVEIFPRNFIKSTYLWLSRRLNCDYVPYIAGVGDYWQRFSIDVPGLERKLCQITGKSDVSAIKFSREATEPGALIRRAMPA